MSYEPIDIELIDKIKYIPDFLEISYSKNFEKAGLGIIAKKNIKKPIVAIGGINEKNYKNLIKAGANYIAISSVIWNNPSLKPEIAIKKFK